MNRRNTTPQQRIRRPEIVIGESWITPVMTSFDVPAATIATMAGTAPQTRLTARPTGGKR